MLHTGFQFIWIFSILVCIQAYYFNNGYMAVREVREEPSTGNYNFEYSERHDDSNNYRKEKRIGNRVTGEYGFKLSDGRMRIVRYIADENGYRTMIDSNETPTTQKQADNYAVQQFESDRLSEFRAHEREQLNEQKRLLNEQIRQQKQIQENEIKRQEQEQRELFENSKENYEQKIDEVYVAPLPVIDEQNSELQREQHIRASEKWIKDQQKHFEEQQIAKQKALEKKEQEEQFEKIRQQQLIQQQKIWRERQLQRQQKKEQIRQQNEYQLDQQRERQNQIQEQQIEQRKERRQKQANQQFVRKWATNNEVQKNSDNYIEQRNEFEQQKQEERTNSFKKEDQWWFKENEQKQINQENNNLNDKLIEKPKDERKIDVRTDEEIKNENAKNEITRNEVDSVKTEIKTESETEKVQTDSKENELKDTSKNVTKNIKKNTSTRIIKSSKNQIKGRQQEVKIEIRVKNDNNLNDENQIKTANRNVKRVRIVEGGRKGGNQNLNNNNLSNTVVLERKPNWVTYGRVEKRKRIRGKTSEPTKTSPNLLEREESSTTTEKSVDTTTSQQNLTTTQQPTTAQSDETTTNSSSNEATTLASTTTISPTTTSQSTTQPAN